MPKPHRIKSPLIRNRPRTMQRRLPGLHSDRAENLFALTHAEQQLPYRNSPEPSTSRGDPFHRFRTFHHQRLMIESWRLLARLTTPGTAADDDRHSRLQVGAPIGSPARPQPSNRSNRHAQTRMPRCREREISRDGSCHQLAHKDRPRVWPLPSTAASTHRFT